MIRLGKFHGNAMKTVTSILTCIATSGLLAWADDESTAAVMQAARAISHENGYAWTSTSASAAGTHDWRQGPTHGKAQKNGYTYVTFTLGDGTVEMAFHREKSVIKWSDQWYGLGDLKEDVAWIADRLKTYKAAAEEAAFLAQHSPDLQPGQDGDYAGKIDDDALRFLLSRGRRQVENVAEIKGTVRFWIQDGRLQKYQYNLKGPVPYGSEGAIVSLDRTTTVELKDIGNVDVKIPPAAEEKLR